VKRSQRSAQPEAGEVRRDDRTIRYLVTRSARRRRTLTITLDPDSGVRVAAPLRVPATEIQALVLRRAGWILRRLDTASVPPSPPRRFESGETLLYLGRRLSLLVEAAPARRVQVAVEGGQFLLRVPAALAGEVRRAAIVGALERWYRDCATDEIGRAVERWAPLVGATPAAVLVRTQRRRWGSCSATGVLRFNWRLALAPPELIGYVVVHELAHLHVRSHAPTFWAAVERVLPDWKLRRRRLHELGPSLSI